MFGSSKRGRMGVAGLALLLALTGAGGASASAASAPAGTSGHWADSIMTEWQSKGLLKGDENGALQADRTITRAEFMAMANRAFEFAATGDVRFKDVNESAWYASDVNIAAQAGYVSGYADGTIRPGQPVSRQEAAAMLAAIAKKLGADKSAGTGNEVGYSDASSIGKWSLSSVETVTRLNVMTGYANGTFGPKGKITRSEAVVAMDRLMKLTPASSDVVYDHAGTYGTADKTTVIEGDAIVRVAGVTLKNVHVKGDLILEKGIGEGAAILDGVTVDGRTTVAGGGEHSVHLIDSTLGTVTIEKAGGGIRLVAQGTTRIVRAEVRSPASLELGAGTELQTLLVYAVVTVTGDGRIVSATLYVSGAKFEHQPEHVDKSGDVTYEAGSGSGSSDGSGSSGSGGSGGDSGGGGETGGGTTGGGAVYPAPTVTGISDGGIYAAGVTPASADTDIDTVTLTKDGNAVPGYSLGTPITANGSYVLTVTDKGGHSATISFSVNIPSSPVQITADPDSIKSDSQGLAIHFDIANNGDSIENVVNGVKLNVPGMAGDTLTGWDGSGYIDFERVGTSDDFVGTFPSHYDWEAGSFVIAPYTLDGHSTHGVDFSVQIGRFADPKTVKVQFWIADAAQPDEEHALYEMDELVLPLEANYTPITDLTVVETTSDTVTLQSTFPTDADYVTIGYGFNVPDENGSWDWGNNPGPGDIQIDAQTGKAKLTLTMPYPGSTYYLQIMVSGGKYDGLSNVVQVDLLPLIENVSDGETYTESVTPSAYGDYDSATLTKDDTEVPDYTLGTEITENGHYTLTVKDHEQTVTVHFTIDSDPAPVITGVVTGAAYKAAVTPDSTDTDIAEVTLTQDSSPVIGYTLGTPISANGAYMLKVKDNAGNETVLSFTVATPNILISIKNYTYDIASGLLSINVDLRNNGSASYVVTGTKLTIPGLQFNYPTVYNSTYGGGSGYMDVTREGADTVIATDEEEFRLAGGGRTTSIRYSIYIGNTTEPTWGEAKFWVGTYDKPSEEEAINETAPIHVDLPANYIGTIDDLTAVDVTDHSATLVSTYPTGVKAAWVDYDKIEEGTTKWSYYNIIQLTPDGPDADGKFRTTAAFNEPGESYYVRLDFGGGMYRGYSEEIVVDLAPALQNVVNGATYTEPVTPSTVNGDIQSVVLTKDGSEMAGYELGQPLSENGSYVLTVTDIGGNSTTVNFTVANQP